MEGDHRPGGVIYRDVAAFTKKAAEEAATRLHRMQAEDASIKLTIRGAEALVENTRGVIAYLDRLARWRLGE